MTYAEEAKRAIAQRMMKDDLEARVAKLEAQLAPSSWAKPPSIHDPAEMLLPCNAVKEPKPIDWSKVADCVPVKVWDDRDEEESLIMYSDKNTSPLFRVESWARCSLITSFDIAWSGGECPLPNGVVVEVTRRKGDVLRADDPRSLSWQAREDGICSAFDIIAFRVVSIHPDWTEEFGE